MISNTASSDTANVGSFEISDADRPIGQVAEKQSNKVLRRFIYQFLVQ
jgi:hypothetical protein